MKAQTDMPETHSLLTPANLAFLADWTFEHGVGNYGQHTACTMSAAVAAVRVARGDDMNGATDRLACVDSVVRRLVIARNDLTPLADLKLWALAMIPRIVGTNGGKSLAVKRAEHIARYAIRVIAADAMDAAKLPHEAAKLRSLSDDTSMSDCRAVASEARDSARKERDKRYAAADAYAAYAAAYAAAAADAAAYAAYAADAYAADAYAAAAKRLQTRLKHLDAMIELCLAIKE